MGKYYSCSSLLFSAFLLQLHLFLEVMAGEETLVGSKREALEIIIGGGGGGGSGSGGGVISIGGGSTSPSPPTEYAQESPPPPSPPGCPSPTPPLGQFENLRLQKAFNAIQKFKSRITSDPKGYAERWNGTDVCVYPGFRCDIYPNTKDRAVSGVDLNGVLLAGCSDFSLTGLLDSLPELTFFHANSNNFSLNIPETVSKFKFFYELDLSNNKYRGEFPKEVFLYKQLAFLDLRFNSFEGPVPPQLFNMQLDVIFINNNNFSNKLPDNFGFTPAKYLTFANNQLTGPIPSSIGLASKTLVEVLFLNNKLSGCLPYEIGYLKKATVFDANMNCLTGPIPHSFACLGSLKYLNLGNNMFYGQVLEQICKLPELVNLTLSNNYFTQVGPECRKLIDKKVLDVRGNCVLDLPDQKSKAECAAFYSKRIRCPNPKSFTYVPCGKYESKKRRVDNYGEEIAAAPVTYKALAPNGL